MSGTWSRVALAAAIAAVAAVMAWWLRRRRPEPPPRAAYPVPRQLQRRDFPRADAPWLVALFSSETCDSCVGLGEKVAALESGAVATCELRYPARTDLHGRYEILAVPMILVADHDGVVQRAFVGSTTATDLWAALAEVRAPGSTPEPGLGTIEA